MLSRRYLNDGKLTHKLNKLQASTKGVVSIKEKENIYQFEDTTCKIYIAYQHFFPRFLQLRSSWPFSLLMLLMMVLLSHASMAGVADINQHTILSQTFRKIGTN